MISGQRDDRMRFRVTVLGLVVVSLFSVLLSRLWFLQVLVGEDFAQAAERNRVRIVAVEAPRGRVYDREGRPLVLNRTSLAVGVRRDDLPKNSRRRLDLLRRVARLLDMDLQDVRRRLRDKRVSPYKAVVIKEDVPQEIIFRIRERQELYPGVEAVLLPVRVYPKGTLSAHILGYVGEISETELKQLRDRGYRLGDGIGKTGVERTYEEAIRGRPGLDKLEVDAAGRVLRTLGRQEPLPGADLYLSVDAEVQKVAEESLRDGIRRARGRVFEETHQRFRAPAGSAVVLDARTGEVVAMASYPSYDPDQFVGGVDADYFGDLNDPDNDFPLLNRALQAAYPPGSTIKPIISTAALETGAASRFGRYSCTSDFEFGDRTFRNWKSGSGPISLQQALVESCDTVFYRFGANWWRRERTAERNDRTVREVMQQWARRYGLGRPTGIDLPNETAGRVPDRAFLRGRWEANRAEWCRQARKTKDVAFVELCERGWFWRGGDSVNMSIGQGELTVTPLQLAVAYGAIANGGRVVTPHVGLRIDPPKGKPRLVKVKPRGRLKADGDTLAYIRGALRATSVRGTAQFPYRGWPHDRISVAAKTGSAEIAGKQPFSWFASFAPTDHPKYVVVAVVEQAGFGSQVAGPVVRRIMDKLFDRRLTPVVFGVRSD